MLKLRDNSSLWFLERINSLSLPLDQPLYCDFPAMKLGHSRQLDFFSRELCTLVKAVLQQMEEITPSLSNWVLTAPPFYTLPSAANLLARRVHALLKQQACAMPLLEPRLGLAQIEVQSMDEFRLANDYSKSSLQQRIQERQRVQDLAKHDAFMEQFRYRKVIIINDIYVTGTQQTYMQKNLDAVAATECHWLYIFHVESTLAQQHPDIEFLINNHRHDSLESFAEIIDDEQTQHTTRCLSRLFNESMDNFEHVISLLKPGMRKKIFGLASEEHRYRHPIFAEKMQLLTRLKLATTHD